MPLYIVRKNIIKMKCDAIVNTTNKQMIGYSGVDKAIHIAAGKELDKECKKIAPLGLGSAKITSGYNLNCKYIIHTSGPTWMGGNYNEKSILKSCYIESLKLALKYNCNTIAFPLISSGSYGYPKDQVLTYAVEIISNFLNDNEMTIYLCVYDETSYEFSKQLFSELTNFINDNYEDNTLDTDYSIVKIQKRSYPNSINPAYDISKFHKARKEKSLNSSLSSLKFLESKCVDFYKDEAIILEEFLKKMDETFSTKLLRLIDEHGMTDVECYKKANIDKRIFSKIRSNKNYKPSKTTAVAFAISLKLSWEETIDFLSSAGIALSHSNAFDMIIEFFIKKGKYNIFEINEALFEFKQPLLGSH